MESCCFFKRTKLNGNWEDYKTVLGYYNKEMRKSNRKSFCEGINNIPTAARLQKALRKDHSNFTGFLRKVDGSYTESVWKTISLLLDTHFLGSTVLDSTQTTIEDRIMSSSLSWIRQHPRSLIITRVVGQWEAKNHTNRQLEIGLFQPYCSRAFVTTATTSITV